MNQERQKKIIIPVSGGKDSTLTLVHAIELNGVENCIPLFYDTGWDHPETYAYLSRLESSLGIVIQKTHGTTLHGKQCSTMEELLIEAGEFPNRKTRFCSRHFKADSSYKWIKANCVFDNNIDYEVWSGVRTAESSNRKKKYGKFDTETIYDYDEIFPGILSKKYLKFFKIKLPILDLSTSQVFNELRQRKIEINPLYYERTNDRVGCYPCFIASKTKQQKMFNTEFGKIQLAKIREVEKIIGKKYEMIEDEDAPCGFCLI